MCVLVCVLVCVFVFVCDGAGPKSVFQDRAKVGPGLTRPGPNSDGPNSDGPNSVGPNSETKAGLSRPGPNSVAPQNRFGQKKGANVAFLTSGPVCPCMLVLQQLRREIQE